MHGGVNKQARQVWGLVGQRRRLEASSDDCIEHSVVVLGMVSVLECVLGNVMLVMRRVKNAYRPNLPLCHIQPCREHRKFWRPGAAKSMSTLTWKKSVGHDDITLKIKLK